MEKLALKLMDDIQKRTHEQLQILEENFHTQRESQINQFNQEAVEESNLYIEQELAELKSSVMQSETQLKWKIKKNLFIRREELVEGLFEQLRDKLCAYSKTEAYLTQYLKFIEETIAKEGFVNTSVLVKAEDVDAFSKALKAKNLTVMASDHIEVGGVIIQEAGGKMAIEMTLDHQLKVQKEWFFAHSDLQF